MRTASIPRHTIITFLVGPCSPAVFLPLRAEKVVLGDKLYSVCCDKAFKKEDSVRKSLRIYSHLVAASQTLNTQVLLKLPGSDGIKGGREGCFVVLSLGADVAFRKWLLCAAEKPGLRCQPSRNIFRLINYGGV